MRLPYSAEPTEGQLASVTSEHSLPVSADGATEGKEQRTYQHRPNDREVRWTIVRVIRDHLTKDAPVSWRGHDFDFTGAVFDCGDFSKAVFAPALDERH